MEKSIYTDDRNHEKQILMIRFLQNSEINRTAWDKCINESRQGLIYGMSWYLDLVSPGWCGLEEDDYAAVMPLPVKKKYRIPYIIQPIYTQQLGVFSKKEVPSEKITEFINSIPSHYRFIALNLNFANEISSGIALTGMNSNFELALDPTYEYIETQYSTNTRRNIQKATGLDIRFNGSVEELVRLKAENTAKNRKRISSQIVMEYISAVVERGSGFVCTASEDEKTCAAVFFLHHQKRIYYLIPVSDSRGKEKKAMFAIIDLVIQKFAGSSMILDFEGSNLPGLTRFFEGFGAVNHPYPVLKINRMPFPLNQFRKT